MTYVAADDRYERHAVPPQRSQRPAAPAPSRSASGTTSATTGRSTASARSLRRAFDLGITHFDLANNYGPPAGSAEENFGRLLREDFRPYRDELVISTKAGYDMWPGPYGEWGSRKYVLASLDQSLERMGLDYVDIFYSHRLDPDTPLEETMGALATAVQQGKALYVGVSSYSPDKTREAAAILRGTGRAAAHPPAVVLHAQPLDRGRPARRPGARRASAASASRRSPRACSATATCRASPRAAARARTASSRPTSSPTRPWTRCAPSNAIAERRGQRAGADGAGVDAARRPHDLDARRRLQRRAAGGQRRGPRAPRLHAPTSSPRSTTTPPTAASTCGRARARRSARRHGCAVARVGPASERHAGSPLTPTLPNAPRTRRLEWRPNNPVIPPRPPLASRVCRSARPPSRWSTAMPAGSSTGGTTRRSSRSRRPFEETAYLLWHSRLPDDQSSPTCASDVVAGLETPPEVLAVLRDIGNDALPMDALRTGLSAWARAARHGGGRRRRRRDLGDLGRARDRGRLRAPAGRSRAGGRRSRSQPGGELPPQAHGHAPAARGGACPRCVLHPRRRARAQRLDVHRAGHRLDAQRHRLRPRRRRRRPQGAPARRRAEPRHAHDRRDRDGGQRRAVAACGAGSRRAADGLRPSCLPRVRPARARARARRGGARRRGRAPGAGPARRGGRRCACSPRRARTARC